MQNYEKQISDILGKNDVSLKSDEIILKAGLRGEDIPGFMDALNGMVEEGRIFITKRGKYMMPEAVGLVPADIISMQRGYSFARPKDGGDDIFIHGKKLHGALLGDTVLVNVNENSEKGPEGEVERIVKNGSHEVTGKVTKGFRGLEFQSNSGIRFSLPIENRGKSKTKLKPSAGEKVKAEIFVKKGKFDDLYAKVEKIYGDAESAKVSADSIVDANGIPSVFPNSVKNQAKEIEKSGISSDEYKNRLDLRNEIIFTIDGEGAKDLDDAVSIKPIDGGGWELGVHIADVSHYVTAKSPIDEEAMKRGTSVYFADRVIPMLPVELSNGLCSLNAGVDRLTFSAFVTLDKNAQIKSYKFKKSVISSCVRGVYSEINQIFGGTADETILKKYEKAIPTLKEMRKCADKLKENAAKRGSLDIETVESEIKLDENGKAVYDCGKSGGGDACPQIRNSVCIQSPRKAAGRKNKKSCRNCCASRI